MRFPGRRASLATVMALAAALHLGCRREARPRSPAPSPPVATVRVAAVESHDFSATEDIMGTLRTQHRAVVEAKVAGRIESLLAVPGQAVQQGALLVTLDAREIQARLDSALAIRDQATRDLERFTRLVKDGAIAPSDLDAAESRRRVAAAAATEAEALLTQTRIIAPFDGVITRKWADAGDLATPGRPILEIEDPSRLRLEADLPEALLERVSLGAKLAVRVAARPAPLEGAVSEIAPAAEAVSRTFLVKLDLPPTPGLRAGQFGRVAVPTGTTGVPHFPARALIQRGQLEYVFVVDTGKAHLRLIRTGRRIGDDLQIVSGLQVGERVVTDGVNGLTDGQPVEVK